LKSAARSRGKRRVSISWRLVDRLGDIGTSSQVSKGRPS
jgi:hypothetical protein